MASGQAVLAYDTYYYKELAAAGAPVHVVPWRDEQALATRLLQLCDDRERLARDMRAAVDFARANTQEVWIDRRVQWTIEACAG
jgi:glycosyltransferase involved in cell wall biosynthesis